MTVATSRLVLTFAIATLLVGGLAGCTPEAEEPVAEETPTSSATPSATATTEPSDPTTPVEQSCEQIVTPQAMYDFNPNFALSDSYTPEAGTDAATIVEKDGLVCAWVNETSGELITAAVANLPTAELDALKNDLVVNSNSVPTYDIEGYFQVLGTTGVAQAFAGPYWIVSESTFYLEPGDAAPIIAAVRGGLGQ